MKKRISYVSNSSSSSYIVAYNQGDIAQVPGFKLSVERFFWFIESNCHDWSGECTEIKEKGKDCVCDYIKDNWYDDKQFYIEKINKCDKDTFVYFKINYHDELLKELFNFLVENNVVQIIYNEDW